MDRQDSVRLNRLLEEKFEALNDENSRLQRLIREKEGESEKNEAKIVDINKKILLFEDRFMKCIEEKNFWEDRANALELKLVEEEAVSSQRGMENEEKVRTLSLEIESLRSELASEKSGADNLKYYEQKIEQIFGENDRLNKIIDEYDLQVCEKGELIKTLEEQKEALQRKNSVLVAELNIHKNCLNDCRTEIERLTQISASSSGQIDSYEAKINSLRNDNEDLNRDIALARDDLRNAEEKVGYLHKNMDNLNELLKQKVSLLEAERAIAVKFESEKTALLNEKSIRMAQIRDLERNLEETKTGASVVQGAKVCIFLIFFKVFFKYLLIIYQLFIN
jgi:chromosome segregation ATPase